MVSRTTPTGQALGPVWPSWSPSARRDGGSRELGSCHRDFRNRPHPLRVRITYWGQRLQVSGPSYFLGSSGEGVQIIGLRAAELCKHP